MKRIRYYLAAIALLASLSGLSLLQGMGSIANAASSWQASSVSAPFVAGQLTRSDAFIPQGPCPGGGPVDC